MTRKEDIEGLIKSHQRRLQKLEEQQALKGISVDPAIPLEIEDIKQTIKALQKELEAHENIAGLSELPPALPKLPPTKPITNIFLSYDWEDRPDVRHLVDNLRSHGVKVAWDQDWPHWHNFEEELKRAISNADVIVLYSTSHAQYSEWVKDELEMARQAQKRVVTLEREPGVRWGFFGDEDRIDISHITARAVDTLIQKLNPSIHPFKALEDKRSVKELLQAALEANLGIPSDTITDKIFVSPEACRLVEMAYETAIDRLDSNNPDRLLATLEYGRLRRFQGEWSEADRVFELGREFAKGQSELYTLFCLEFGSLKFERGGTFRGIELIREALGDIKKRGVTRSRVKALRLLGNMLTEQGKWEEAMRHLNAAMYLAEALKDEDNPVLESVLRTVQHILWIDCIRERASLLKQQGNIDEALQQFQVALRATEEAWISKACEHLRGIILYHLGGLYLAYKNDVRSAVESFDAGLRILRKYDNPARLAFVYDGLGRALTEQHPRRNFEDILLHLKKAKRVHQRCNHKYLTARAELSLGEFYLRSGQVQLAINAYRTARYMFNELGKTPELGIVLLALGTTYARSQKVEDARECLEKAKREFQKIKIEEKIREVEFVLLNLQLSGELRDLTLDELLDKGKSEQYEFHLKEVGEYRFHQWIKTTTRGKFPRTSLLNAEYKLSEHIITLTESKLSELIRVGVGDDAAVIGIPGSEIYDLVLTTDVAPGSLSRTTKIEMGSYAAKFSVVQCLSDILAMGGIPVAILLNMGLNRDSTLEYAMAVIKTVMEEAYRYSAILIGGDTKERMEQFIACVGIGVVEKGKAIRRDSAGVGQIVAITLAGMPNRSGLRKIGCRWAQEVIEHLKLAESEPYRSFYREKDWKRELLFLSYKEIIAGVRTGLVRSAIDTSDGVLACLKLLGRESRVSFELDEALIEAIIDDRVTEIARALDLRPAQFLFNAGHDWEIVLTVEEQDFLPLRQVFRDAGGDLAPLGIVRPWTHELEDGIALISSEPGNKKFWIPFFTDEKFVRLAYEERPTEWEDLKFYLEGRRELE